MVSVLSLSDHMDNELLRIFSEELRAIRGIAFHTRKIAEAAMKSAQASVKIADASMGMSESAWELVVITRNQMREDAQKAVPWRKGSWVHSTR